MSVWQGLKNTAGDLLGGIVEEAKIFSGEYVASAWSDAKPVAQEKKMEAENIAAIPNAGPVEKSGTGALLHRPINWQAVSAVAAVAAAGIMIIRSR